MSQQATADQQLTVQRTGAQGTATTGTTVVHRKDVWACASSQVENSLYILKHFLYIRQSICSIYTTIYMYV